MARSIHDTWGVKHRAERASFSDDGIQQAIVAEAEDNWFRQGVIREHERRRRRQRDVPPQPVHPDSVPISVEDEAPYVFHPAGEEDVRAVMRRLPPGSLDGLQAVRLRVDRAEARSGPRVRDPFTGRLSHEIFPGVFVSSTAGRYDRETAIIELFACLCESAEIGRFAVYLKAQALVTFLHEAAHHFDLTFRVRRSRWDLSDKTKKEAWARRVEHEQGIEIVVPFLRERYARECDELTGWVEARVGVALSIEPLLIEETAFRGLVRGVLGGGDRDVMRASLARTLHRAGANEDARAVVRAVLADRPDHPSTLAASACIVQCADRDFETGEALCLKALAADPGCMDAHETLVRGYAVQEKWEQAAAACEHALSLLPEGDTRYGDYVLGTLAQAYLNLGGSDEVQAVAARMRASGTDDADLWADVWAVLARCCAEQWENALLTSTRMLSTGKYGDWDTWLAAVRFECAHRLRRPHLGGSFGKASLAQLQSSFPSWARRIREDVRKG